MKDEQIRINKWVVDEFDGTVIHQTLDNDVVCRTEFKDDAELIARLFNNREKLVEHLSEIHNRYRSLMTAKINAKTELLLNAIKS